MSSMQQENVLEMRPIPDIIGKSPQAKKLRDFIDTAASNGYPVLILGERGAGKDRMAKAIHSKSHRTGQFVPVNCTTLQETLFESALFGHQKGAFTGAHEHKAGLFETAEYGTLFLNEIAEMSPTIQAKLLEVLGEKRYRRVGSNTEKSVKARIIAATNVDIKEAMRKGKMRADLYDRLDVLTITVPPLRERKEDIPELAEHFLREEHPEKILSPEAKALLSERLWLGNVRQLKHAIIKAVVASAEEESIRVEHVASQLEKEAPAVANLPTFRKARENYFHELMLAAKGNVSKASRMSGITRQNVYHNLKRFGLEHMQNG